MIFDDKKMNDTISNLFLPTFSNTQRFLVTLLCEYYEAKRTKESQEITEIFDENKSLRNELKKMSREMRFLREDNRKLSSKLRSANNMIRILTKSRESAVDEYKTPTQLNIHGVENLLKRKINNKVLVSNNFNVKSNEVLTRTNNKPILKSTSNEEPKNLNNFLKKIVNKKGTTSSFARENSHFLTIKKNVISTNAPKEINKTEESKFDALQKLKENRKKEIPKKVQTKIQLNRDVGKRYLDEPSNRNYNQDKASFND